jgi:hypothetical protein
MLTVLGSVLLCLAAAPAASQEEMVRQPPAELRQNLDAFMKAFNSGSADQYEAMAKATFSPDYFKREAIAARKAAYTRMFKEFGSIAFEQVERNGPDAPLQAHVTGSVKSGVFWIDLDPSHRINGIRTEGVTVPGTTPHAHRRH